MQAVRPATKSAGLRPRDRRQAVRGVVRADDEPAGRIERRRRPGQGPRPRSSGGCRGRQRGTGRSRRPAPRRRAAYPAASNARPCGRPNARRRLLTVAVSGRSGTPSRTATASAPSTYSRRRAPWRGETPPRSAAATRTASPCPCRSDPEDRAGAVADEQRPVRRERQAARDAEVRGERLERSRRRPRGTRCPRTGSRRTAGPPGRWPSTSALTMPDEKVSRVPFGRTRKIDTGTSCPRVPL